MHFQRVNTFLSEHQSLRDVAFNSLVSLVRDHSTLVDDIRDEQATEPPVDQFVSGFVGATDEELWKNLDRLAEEDTRDRGGCFDHDLLFALDETSRSKGG